MEQFRDISVGAAALIGGLGYVWGRWRELELELGRKLAREAWDFARGGAGNGLRDSELERVALGYCRHAANWLLRRWTDEQWLGSLRWVLARERDAAAVTIRDAWEKNAPAVRAELERLDRAGERAAELELERAPGGAG